MITRVMDKQQFAQQWPRCLPWIQAALTHNPHKCTTDEVRAGLLDGTFTMWLGPNSVGVTMIVPRGDERICVIYLAGGDILELVQLGEPIIQEYARHNRCTMLEVTGRKGWERALSQQGYKYGCTVLVKHI